jgi:hypothetical protein
MCHLFCDSLDAYQASFGPHAQEIRADIQKFTDRTSIHQISEVVVENSATKMQHPIPRDRGSSSHKSEEVSQ